MKINLKLKLMMARRKKNMKLKMMKKRILSVISKDGDEETNDDSEGRNEFKAEVDDGENIICKCLNKSVQ